MWRQIIWHGNEIVNRKYGSRRLLIDIRDETISDNKWGSSTGGRYGLVAEVCAVYETSLLAFPQCGRFSIKIFFFACCQIFNDCTIELQLQIKRNNE